LREIFVSGSAKVNFSSFCRVAGHFLVEEDDEAMQQELKEAFRLYDKEGMHRCAEKWLLKYETWPVVGPPYILLSP
jgi:Ca2+-binding EF-hand superfamily protein